MKGFPSTGIKRILLARSALFGIAMISGLSIISSTVGFVFQIVLAARFGAGAAIDSYLFAISVPTFLAGLGSAAVSYLVVPALVLEDNNPAARAAMLRTLRRSIGGIAIGFSLIGFPAIVAQRVLLPADAEIWQVEALPTMIALGWAIGGVQLFSALFVAELNAARRPVAAALLSIPPNLGAITVVLLAPTSISIALAGVLLGSLVALIIGFFLTIRAFNFMGGDEGRATKIRPNIGRLSMTLLAMSCFSAYALIDAFWAPRAGEGVLASLGYSQRLIVGIGSLIVAGPSAILVPRFAARLRDGGRDVFLSEVRYAACVVALLAVATAAVLWLLAEPLIAFAFGRGAFDAQDVVRVSAVFRSMLPGFAAMLVSVVLTRAAYCLSAIERPMAINGLLWSIIYFFSCKTLLPLGGVGFGVSYSLAWFIYLTIVTWIVHRYVSRVS